MAIVMASYIVATGWANYCSNSILEGKNLGGYCLFTDYYYNKKYLEGLQAHLVSRPMVTFEKHKSLLLYPHLLL